MSGGRIERRQIARLLDADADGVNLHAERGGELRGGQRINLAQVVVAVRQQNHDAAFAVRHRLEPLGRDRHRVADGRAEVA